MTRRIREAIQIRKKGGKAINCDDGIFSLDHVYDPLLKPTLNPRNENNTKLTGKAVDQITCDQAIRPDGESLKGLTMIFTGQENPFIIFRSKEIYIYFKTNIKIPINLLK